MDRGDLSNEQWETLKPLLPPLKPRTGKPNHDHRQVVNGILWILRTGAPWRDLPERYGSWQSVATRFYRWQKANIWQQVLEHLQASADREGNEVEEKLGRSRGGFSTKIHIRCEGKGKPITFLLSPGQLMKSIPDMKSWQQIIQP